MVDCQSARCILGSEDGSRHGGSRFGEQVVPSGPNLTMGADFFLPPAPSSFASWQLFLAPWSCCSTFLAPSAPRWHRAWSLLKYSNSNEEGGADDGAHRGDEKEDENIEAWGEAAAF